MKPIEAKRKTLRYLNGTTVETEDRIVTEYPLTIKINRQEFITLVCTPDYLEDLVIGYLSSEGVINSLQDIEDLWIQEKEGIAHIKTNRTNPYYQSFSKPSLRYFLLLE